MDLIEPRSAPRGLPEVSSSSEWCQRWRNGRHGWRHAADGGFDTDRYQVEPIDEATARAYVVTHHYSGQMPAAVQRYGLFDGADLAGVCILGVPMQAKVLTNVFPTLEPYSESLELSRLVLADAVPANGETWFLARVFEQAAARGLRGVVSFADPVPRRAGNTILFPGHIGICYQAKGAVYLGRSTPRTLTLLPAAGGTVLSARTLSKIRTGERGSDGAERRLVELGATPRQAGQDRSMWLRDALDAVGAVGMRHRGCHRYAWALGTTRSARRNVRINLLGSAPYPKGVDAA